MKNIFRKVFAAVIILSTGFSALAVTQEEMDEARAIAGKFYIRYINDGAGYLDNWTPKSMAELEKKLTNKTDRENFNTFKSAPSPTDYASWNKDELASYWSDAFFKENKSTLNAKAADNGLCKKQIKQAIGKMAVAAPAAAVQEPTQETQPEEPAAEEPIPALEDQVQQELARVDGEMQEAQDIVDQESLAPVETQSSGTWVYIMILAILVAVVIFLVAYASKTMKGKPESKRISEEPREEETAKREGKREEEREAEKPRNSVADDSRMREKYAEALAAKAEEIRSLNRQLADMENLAATLKDENRRLTAEVERLSKFAAASQPVPSTVQNRHGDHHHHHHHNDQQTSKGEAREIYLGRVNSKGIFVRADRHAVDGQSVYKLTTTNGQSGTFSLIGNPLITEQVLEDPGKWLAGGCVAKDIFDTEGKNDICMEIPGTAVFSDGAWRVERKARIRYC